MSTLRSALGSWFAPLLIHGLNQQEALQRAASAKGQGLDPATFGTPFPGGVVTTTTTNNQAGGWLKGALLGSAILTAGILGTLAGPTIANKAAAPPVVSVPADTPKPLVAGKPTPAHRDGEMVIEQQQPDGSWRQTTELPAKPLGNGLWQTPDGRRWREQADGTLKQE